MMILLSDEAVEGFEINPKIAVVDIAIGLYKRQEATLARAARVAGLSRVDFQREMSSRNIPLNVDEDDLKREVATLRARGVSLPAE